MGSEQGFSAAAADDEEEMDEGGGVEDGGVGRGSKSPAVVLPVEWLTETRAKLILLQKQNAPDRCSSTMSCPTSCHLHRPWRAAAHQ
jgi:hypothetical protein